MKSVVVGTAGHIDHGKSALVRALTGTDPDRLKEEQARGITIDLGFAHQTIEGINFAFVDVPGHERFVKNMLAGVGGIDLVVLVVAADESVMPQTREHFDICRLLRVPAGVVALTKSDLVDAETLELVRLEVRELVEGSFLDGAAMIAVSSRTGDGLDSLRQALVAASARTPGRPIDAAVRLPIDRVFSMKGFGTVVTGTLVSGRIQADDALALSPPRTAALPVKVRGVQVHGERRAEAVAGERTAVNVGGVNVQEIERGQNLVTPGAFEETRLVDAAMEVLPDARPLKHGARVRFHQGTAEILGRVALIGPIDPSGGVPAMQPGSRAYVRLRLEAQAVLARGDRYIIRAYSPPVTIAGGIVLDPRPPRTAIRTQAAIDRCRRLDFDPSTSDRFAPGQQAARVMVVDAAGAGFPVEDLVRRASVPPSGVNAAVEALTSSGEAALAGPVLVSAPIVTTLKDQILETLAEHHRVQPLSEGIPRDELRDRLFGRGHAAIFELALTQLATAGRVAVRDRVALASHRLELSPEEERARAAIERTFRERGLSPPDVATLGADIGAPAPVVDRVLKLLQRQKVLVRVDTLLFHDDALKRLKAEVATLKAATGAVARIDVATFKERFGVTRKFAIPLLEYLDRERVTRRTGDARVVL